LSTKFVLYPFYQSYLIGAENVDDLNLRDQLEIGQWIEYEPTPREIEILLTFHVYVPREYVGKLVDGLPSKFLIKIMDILYERRKYLKT